jgi:hypothetical protein
MEVPFVTNKLAGDRALIIAKAQITFAEYSGRSL